MSYSEARHIIAAARGVPMNGGPSRCVVCGESPYPTAAPAGRVLLDTFTDHDALCDPTAPDVCVGCLSLLAGRPGDDPPPLRASHCVAIPGEPACYPATADLAAYLRDPPADRWAIVWSASRKRHASLRAQVSTRTRLMVGCDTGTAEYLPARHGPALAAVETMLGGFTRDEVRTGAYPTSRVRAFGAGRWADLDAIVAPLRGSLVLTMICALAPKGPKPEKEAPVMIDPHDQAAAELLALVALGSRYRAEHGKEFWGGYYRHRVERFRALPLAQCVSRLLDSCQTAPVGEAAQDLIVRLSALDAEQTAAIETAIRERPALCVALAYDYICDRRTAR